MKFNNKLFLQLDSYDKALYLCQKLAESIMRLCLLAEKHVYKNFQIAFCVRMISNNITSQIIIQSFSCI